VTDILKFTKTDIENAVASLKGQNVRPLDRGHYSATVAVPKRFIREGDTPEESILRYLDYLDEMETSA